MEETYPDSRGIQRALLDPLQFILTGSGSSESSDNTIQFLDPSFVDFITDLSRYSPRFKLDKRAEHYERMAKACLLRLRGLKGTLCELKDLNKLDSNGNGLDELVKTHISWPQSHTIMPTTFKDKCCSSQQMTSSPTSLTGTQTRQIGSDRTEPRRFTSCSPLY